MSEELVYHLDATPFSLLVYKGGRRGKFGPEMVLRLKREY